MASKISNTLAQLHIQLRAIEETLQKPVGPGECRRLFHKLEEASSSLQGLAAQTAKTQNLFARTISLGPVLSGLNDRIVDLAGRVVNKKVESAVSEIREEASHLEATLTTATSSQLSKEAKVLQRHIQALLHDHRPSKEHLQVLAEAKETLQKAEQKLEGKDVTTPPRHFDWLSKQQPQVQFVQEALDLMPGEVEELFDIAALVYSQETKMAKLRYNQLPEDTKSRVARHLAHLSAQVFEDVLETVQALMATAHELVGNGGNLPTEQEVHAFFAERMQVIQEENTGDGFLPIVSEG